jgi:hypothetical protein
MRSAGAAWLANGGACRFSERQASRSAGTSAFASGLSRCHPGRGSGSWQFLDRADTHPSRAQQRANGPGVSPRPRSRCSPRWSSGWRRRPGNARCGMLSGAGIWSWPSPSPTAPICSRPSPSAALTVDDTAAPQRRRQARAASRELRHAELTTVAAEHVAALPAARRISRSVSTWMRGCGSKSMIVAARCADEAYSQWWMGSSVSLTAGAHTGRAAPDLGGYT